MCDNTHTHSLSDTTPKRALRGHSGRPWHDGRVSALIAALSVRTRGPAGRRDRPGGAWMFEGLLAAVLGLGALAIAVLLLWTTSPHPDSGPGGALRIAVDLWLLSQGALLERTDTLSGLPAPVGITPLMLSVLPGWLLWRAVRVSLRSGGESRDAVRAALWITAGYLAAGAAAVLCTAAQGTLRPVPWTAAVALPLFALLVTLAAAARMAGTPRLPERLAWARHTGPLRAAAAGVATLCGAGGLLAAGALAVNAGEARAVFLQLAGDWSGRVALLLLVCVLAPNAAVWAAAYGLGAGFAAGEGTLVTPLGAGADPLLPAFPLFAAVPQEGAPESLLALLAPLAGVGVTVWFLVRAAVPVRADRATAADWPATLRAALLAALAAGAALALLAALTGGPLGSGRLAAFGPVPWLTGLAAFAWTAVLGAPAALAVRAWRLRRPDFTRHLLATGGGTARAAAARVPRPRLRSRGRGRRQQEGGDAWHATLARRMRWDSLRRLTTPTEPVPPPEPPVRPPEPPVHPPVPAPPTRPEPPPEPTRPPEPPIRPEPPPGPPTPPPGGRPQR